MQYTFKNNGRPYIFTDSYCGGGKFIKLSYDSNVSFNLRCIELVEKTTKKLFGAINTTQYIIKIGYQLFSSEKEISYNEIAVSKEELNNARKIVKYLEGKIEAYLDYRNPIDEDNKIYNMKTVPVLDVDGKTYNISVSMQLDDDTKCLVCGGKTYHTHLNCFKNWTVDMRKNFKGWQIINLCDAKKQGLEKCKFCDENDSITLDDILDDSDDCNDEID